MPRATSRALFDSVNERGDRVPGITGDDKFAFLDFLRPQIHLCRNAVDSYYETGNAGRDHAARFALNRLERNAGAIKFFPNVRGDFQLAFVEWSQWHRVSPPG